MYPCVSMVVAPLQSMITPEVCSPEKIRLSRSVLSALLITVSLIPQTVKADYTTTVNPTTNLGTW